MTISQREARSLRRRVRELEDELNLRVIRWTDDYPSWTRIGSESMSATMSARIKVARQLKHAVLVVENADGLARYYACELREGGSK